MKNIYLFLSIATVFGCIVLTQCKKSEVTPMEAKDTESSDRAILIGTRIPCKTVDFDFSKTLNCDFKYECGDSIKSPQDFDATNIYGGGSSPCSGMYGDYYTKTKRKMDSLIRSYTSQYKNCRVTTKITSIKATTTYIHNGRTRIPFQWGPPMVMASCYDSYTKRVAVDWRFTIRICCPDKKDLNVLERPKVGTR